MNTKRADGVLRRGARTRGTAADREGAVLVLVAVAVLILLAMAMFTVDVAYMQLTRTELRAATDAAAKAGAEALSREQSDSAAISAAVAQGARNNVAGRPLTLTADDIDLGRSTRQGDGTWQFVAGETPFSAVRVRAALNDGNANGAVNLFFAGLFGRRDFSPSQQATASHMEQEICLVIDRSHSMCFDLSGVDWRYPPGIPGLNNSLKYAPHATLSRWASLERAMDIFLATLAEASVPPRVALITWASNITTSSTEYRVTGLTSPVVAIDVPLTHNLPGIQAAITTRGDNPMLGGTNLAAGMDAGVTLLTAANIRPLAKRVMIVMTDGQWNQGRDPLLSAGDAQRANITVHTISFLPGASQATMRSIAAMTGGQFYEAGNDADLRRAFEELARNLPVVLTD